MMVKKIMKEKIIILCIVIFQISSCQMKKKDYPEFRVDINHPGNEYIVYPIVDNIKTEEGIHAGFPYGGSSGSWGYSRKYWTEQHGTPIGLDIEYLSEYEKKFYKLDVDFPKDTIDDYMQRAYCIFDSKEEILEEYKYLGRGMKSKWYQPYSSFSDLVLGFAPKGMVVVWLRFGLVQKELGRYQSVEITDTARIAELKRRYAANYPFSVSDFDEVLKDQYLPDASPEKWDNYRKRYYWRPMVHSGNPKFNLRENRLYYYNGEWEEMLQPWVSDPEYRERAVPRKVEMFWNSNSGIEIEYRAEIYFNWEKTQQAFEKAGEKAEMKFDISKDYQKMEVFINNEPLKVDSLHIYKY